MSSKYAALPDLDTAPDIYETPSLTDGASTVETSTVATASLRGDEDLLDEDDDYEHIDEDASGISHPRLRVKEARDRFLRSTVDASSTDFSDRVGSKRRFYYTSHRRNLRTNPLTGEEYGEYSDADDFDSEDEAKLDPEAALERRIARLKRDVEEAKASYEQHQATKDEENESDNTFDQLQSLGRILENLTQFSSGDTMASPPTTSTAKATESTESTETTPDEAPKTTSTPTSPIATTSTTPVPVSAQNLVPFVGATPTDRPTYTITYKPQYDSVHTLARAAEFDRRLTLLEKVLGVASTAGGEFDSQGLPRAVLPTLNALNKKVSMLAQATAPKLDTITRRVRELAVEAKTLADNKAQAREARLTATTTTTTTTTSPSQSNYDDLPPLPPIHLTTSTSSSQPLAADREAPRVNDEQAAKINALYGTLPTIENLAPLLPPLLDRLRSLRAIHANAATASETLDRIEQQQADMAAELRQWREGLEKVEATVQENSQVMAGNVQVMEEWVGDLQARVKNIA